jgi:hypothetical protein
MSYFTEPKEVYFLHTIWNYVGTRSVKTMNISRSNQDGSNNGVRTSYISQTVEGNVGSSRLL